MARGQNNVSDKIPAALISGSPEGGSNPLPPLGAALPTNSIPQPSLTVDALLEQSRRGREASQQALALLEEEDKSDQQLYEQRKSEREKRKSELLGFLGHFNTDKKTPGRPRKYNKTAKANVGVDAPRGRGRRSANGLNKSAAIAKIVNELVDPRKGSKATDIVKWAKEAHGDLITTADVTSSLQAMRRGSKVKYKGEARDYTYFPMSSRVHGAMIGEKPKGK